MEKTRQNTNPIPLYKDGTTIFDTITGNEMVIEKAIIDDLTWRRGGKVVRYKLNYMGQNFFRTEDQVKPILSRQ